VIRRGVSSRPSLESIALTVLCAIFITPVLWIKCGVSEVMDIASLLVKLMLYVLLPLWSVAGFADWMCHRHTRIETTSGLKESLMHSAMGIQVGIPIVLCLLFEINVLVLLICFAAWVLHELVAHWDVHYTSDMRHISIWEMHAHNYLATLPMFMILGLLVLKWEVFLQLLSFEWQGHLTLSRETDLPGGAFYFHFYVVMLLLLGVVPYLEENLRCLAELRRRRAVKQ